MQLSRSLRRLRRRTNHRRARVASLDRSHCTFPAMSRRFPLTSAPRHTRFEPRDLPRPRTHTRKMTGKNCENCNGAPAAWFCNSDGKPARARAHLCLFFSRHSAFPKQNLSPCAARRPLTRRPARSAGAYLCTACDVSIHSANKVRRGSTAPHAGNAGPSCPIRHLFAADETKLLPKRPTDPFQARKRGKWQTSGRADEFFSFSSRTSSATRQPSTATPRVLD